MTETSVRPVRLDDLSQPRFSAEAQQILDVMAALAPDCPLDAEALHAKASADTGLCDFGPDDYRERFGVYLAALKKCKNFFVSLLIVAACSVSAEIIQYIFSVGVSDIDDVILNCVGGCIGIGGWKILSSALKNENAVKNVTLVFAVIVTVLSTGVLLR